MADMVKVKMLRALGGYQEGDTRELSSADAKRLAARGVVQITREKAEPEHENKMEADHENKAAATTRKGKK